MNNKYNTYVFYYSKLPEEERRVYRQLLKGLEAHVDKCTVDSVCDTKQIEKILDCIRLENPIIGYYNTYTMHTLDNMVCAVEFDYYLANDRQQEINDAMIEQATKIAAYAKSKGPNIRDQVKAVHEYLVRWEYDRDFKPYSFSPAGALLYGRTVCMGVALAFKLVLDMLEIPSICVRGEHEGEGHAWSQVYYDNAWHFFDVTFDMCSTKNGIISYNSFERSDEPEKYKAWEVFPLPK